MNMTDRPDFEIDPATVNPATQTFFDADSAASIFGDNDSEFSARVETALAERIAEHNVLVALRSAAGLTQEQVAEAWGRAQPHVSRMERSAVTSASLRSLAGYVEALGGSMRLVFELRGARLEVPCTSETDPEPLGRVVGR